MKFDVAQLIPVAFDSPALRSAGAGGGWDGPRVMGALGVLPPPTWLQITPAPRRGTLAVKKVLAAVDPAVEVMTHTARQFEKYMPSVTPRC
jgi:hypothetical protein